MTNGKWPRTTYCWQRDKKNGNKTKIQYRTEET